MSEVGSNVTWDYTTVASSTVAGTSEGMLCAATPVDTDPKQSPQTSWYPYIGQDGNYHIYYFTPSCVFDATCGQRGYIDVILELVGNNGTISQTTTIDQEVDTDTNTLVYQGLIQPITQNQQVTVTAALSQSQKATLAPGKGTKYYLIADKIVIVADNTDGNGSTDIKVGSGFTSVTSDPPASGQPLSYEHGYGTWEWTIGSTIAGPTLNISTSAVQQLQGLSSATFFDQLGFSMLSGANITQLLVTSDGAFTFVAGNFSYASSTLSARSVLAISNGDVQSPNRGLDGLVSGLAILDDYLYAVGDFNATSDGSVAGLNGAARLQYNSSSDAAWQPISGLSTTKRAQTVSTLGSEMLVFTYEEQSVDIWLPLNSSIVFGTSSFIVGSFESATSSSNASNVFLGGQIVSLNQFQTSGSAFITDGGLRPTEFGFDTVLTSGESTASSDLVSNPTNTMSTSRILDAIMNRLSKRQSSSPATATPHILPQTALTNSTAPKILAGAFWTNTSTNQEVTILAGRYVSSDGEVRNIGLLSSNGTISKLNGSSPSGTVMSLAVVEDTLWVGGDFNDTAGDIGQNNLATYDLKGGEWNTHTVMRTGVTPSGAVQINAIVPRDGNVVVAGFFSTLGNTTCNSICEWEKSSMQWKPYGDGLTGAVSSLAFADVSTLASESGL